MAARWLAWLMLAVALAASACSADGARATMPPGPAPLGAPCEQSEDCASRLCLSVAPGRGVCTSLCSDASDCPAVPGWLCTEPNELAVSVCACRATALQEVCGDGQDNECNGLADDCRLCDGRPVPANDPEHCGTCGNACKSGQSCTAGKCECSPSSLTACAAGCADLRVDFRNCGACGNTCSLDQSCVAGRCECPLSTPTVCGLGCANLQTDALNCGACGTRCGAALECVSGKCECAGATDVSCDGETCVDTRTNPSNCGECGTVCAAGLACTDGECKCPTAEEPDYCDGAGCVALATDPAHCGECGRRCSLDQTCTGGECACPFGTPDPCNGVCRALATDGNNCGECGKVCTTGQTCQMGVCTCPSGLETCGDVCVSTSTDTTHCGACGNACRAGESCSGGACVCDGRICSDACRPLSDPTNCGACGTVCGLTQYCSGTACQCNSGLDTACGTDCANLQTSTAHCGNCTTTCTAGQLCEAGVCKAVTCTPSARSCVNGDVFSCSASGTTLVLYDDCADTEYCSAGSSTASCLADVCVQGTPVCNGTVATTCAPDGSGYATGGTNCAATNRACEAGVCKPIVCTPGEESCSGQIARHCNANGTVLTQTTCTAGQFCTVAGISYCAADVCAQSQLACDGNVATTCNTDGSGYTGTRRDCTTLQDECRDGYCFGFGAGSVREQAESNSNPQGAMDRTGSLLLVWTSGTSGLPGTPKFSRFDSTTGAWSATAPVTGLNGTAYPQAVIATSGNNFVVLWILDGRLWANVFTTSSRTWSTAKRVDTMDSPIDYARITIDGKDVVSAGWYQGLSVWVSRRNPANDSWATVSMPAVGGNFDAQLPGLGADAAGNLTVVWVNGTAAHYNRFDASTLAWMPASQTFSTSTSSYRWPSMEMRPDGGALAMWFRFEPASTIMSSRFDPGTKTWSAVPPITGIGGSQWVTATAPNARLLGVSTGISQTNAFFFDDTTRTWGAGAQLPNAPGGINPMVAVSTDGSAMVIAVSTYVYTSHYSPGSSTWSPAVSHGGTGLDFGQRVWMDANGNAIVAWQRPSGGMTSIVVNRFVKYR